MMKVRVGVFDSGVGSFAIHAALRQHLPALDYGICIDNAFFPYGGRQDEVLRARIVRVLEAFQARFQSDLMVVACNTASTLALTDVRAALSVPVVGVVPGIKPAVQMSRSGVLGVLATPATIARGYLDRLINEFAPNNHVVRVAAQELVQIAEDKISGRSVTHVETVLARVLAPFLEHTTLDTVVLGCTHFAHVLPELEQFSQRCVTETNCLPWCFIDVGHAISARVSAVIGASGSTDRSPPGVTEVWTTAPVTEAVYMAWRQRFALEGVPHALEL